MDIQYWAPLSRGFQRMKKALFQPFDVKTWFVVGFTAFLAGLTDYHGGGGSGVQRKGYFDWDDLFAFPSQAWEWLLENPVWFALILFGVFVLIVLIFLLTWLSSRGKFMFLDNVIYQRALVAAPWREYRTEGNSLFLWSLAFGALVFAAIIAYIAACFVSLYGIYENTADGHLLIVPAILMVLGLVVIVLLVSFLELLLCDFVVPIMYRYRLKTWGALRIFLPLLAAQFIRFVAYALLVLLVTVLFVAGVFVVGCLTCCIGFVLLLIPYINAVVLLPLSYAMRAFSVEFLEQFGPEYQIFPRPDVSPAGTPSTTA